MPPAPSLLRGLNPVLVERVTARGRIVPAASADARAQAAEIERRRIAERSGDPSARFAEVLGRVSWPTAEMVRGTDAERAGGPGPFTQFGLSLGASNERAAQIGVDAGTGYGAQIAQKLHRASGEVSNDDVNAILRVARETTDLVTLSTGATGEGGAGIGISNQGSTNLSRGLSVPLGALLATGMVGAGSEVRGGMVDAATIVRATVGDATGPLAGSLNTASGAVTNVANSVTNVAGAVRQVGENAVTVSSNLSNALVTSTSAVATAIETTGGRLATALDMSAGSLGGGLGGGVRDGLTAIGQSVERVAAADGGVPITINVNSAELNKTVLIGMVGATTAIAGGIALGMLTGRAIQRLMGSKG